MRGRFIVEAAVRGCRVDVRLNDVLLCSWPGTFPNKLNWFVNQWVHTGENTLQVDVNEGPSGFDERARVEVELNYYEYDPSATIGKSEHSTIARVEWTPPATSSSESTEAAGDKDSADPLAAEVLDAPPPAYDFPEILSSSGTITESQPEWVWAQGEVIVAGPEVLASATDYVNRLIASIRAKDAAAFDEILGHVFDDIDTAYGLEAGKTARTMIVKKAWDIENWDVKDVQIESVEHKLYAHGRLLELSQAGGEPILQTADDVEKYQFKMRLFFAQVDGSLILAH